MNDMGMDESKNMSEAGKGEADMVVDKGGAGKGEADTGMDGAGKVEADKGMCVWEVVGRTWRGRGDAVGTEAMLAAAEMAEPWWM